MNYWKLFIFLLTPTLVLAQTLPESEIIYTEATTLDVENNRQSWKMIYIDRVKSEIRRCSVTRSMKNVDNHTSIPVFSGKCSTTYNESSAGNLKDSLASVTPSHTPIGRKNTPSSDAVNTGYVLEETWLIDTKFNSVKFCWLATNYKCHPITDTDQTFNFYGN